MEEREGISTAGFGLKQHGAPDGYLMDPSPLYENPNLYPAPTSTSATAAMTTEVEKAATPFSVTTPAVNSSSDLKKKRGRPRKYNPDGTLAGTLSPMPLSSSLPSTAEFSNRKRGRGKSSRWLKKSQMLQSDSHGKDITVGFVGADFRLHVLTVNAGEDVTMKVMNFSQQGPRAICVLSATGLISNVTLSQPMTSGGTVTYEGRFDILSLMGSFMPSESEGTRSRVGGMSVSLVGSDGRVFGGGLAGLFIAAGPVQVVVGSFVMGQERQQPNQKKQRRQRMWAPPPDMPVEEAAAGSGYQRLEPPLSTDEPLLTKAGAVHNYFTNCSNHGNELLFSALHGQEVEEADDDDDDDNGNDDTNDDEED